MHKLGWRWGKRALLPALIAAMALAVGQSGAGETALDRYVRKPDATYSWKVVRKVRRTV